MNKLPAEFYQNEMVTELAEQLLGKWLLTRVNGIICGGMIVETEAYYGVNDKASHAYGGRYTNRTQTMYAQGGQAYVYLCYGIHHLFNVVTGPAGVPHAVLIRGIEPMVGVETMLERRNMSMVKPNLTAGPGALTKALGIDKTLNAADLCGDQVWIEDHKVQFNPEHLVYGPRVGVAYAGEDSLLPWRFYVKGNKFVSKPNS